MANTTNFNWETPDDTDLVKDGAAAIRTLGSAIDTSLVDLKGGTTGQILSKATNTDMDFTWITNDVGDITEVVAGTGISGGGTSGSVTITNTVATTFDAKGDLVAGTGADTFAKLTVGANNTILTADSSTATGLKWATPAAATFVGVNAIRDGASASITANTDFFVPLTTELYDTDGFHDNVTNNERLTIPTGKGGKYLLSATVRWSGATNTFLLNIYKNTSANLQTGLNNGLHRQANNAGGTPYINASIVTDLAAGDYVRVAITGNATGTDPLYCVFSATYLGA